MARAFDDAKRLSDRGPNVYSDVLERFMGDSGKSEEDLELPALTGLAQVT